MISLDWPCLTLSVPDTKLFFLAKYIFDVRLHINRSDWLSCTVLRTGEVRKLFYFFDSFLWPSARRYISLHSALIHFYTLAFCIIFFFFTLDSKFGALCPLPTVMFAVQKCCQRCSVCSASKQFRFFAVLMTALSWRIELILYA
jgi:hypothetical protein